MHHNISRSNISGRNGLSGRGDTITSNNSGVNPHSKYLQPTVASLSRQKSPYRVNIRERLFELEDALLEIKTTTQQKEQNIQSALEKENTKVVQTVNSQIINLKQAIGTLADAVSEEIENLKRSIQSDVDIQLNQNQVKFEQLCQVFSKHENDNSKIIFEINTLKDELQTLHAIEGKNVEKFHGYMEDRLTNMKSDNKKLFEQLRIIIQGNAQQIGICTKEFERLENQLELVRTSNNNLNDNYTELTKKILNMDKDIVTQFKQISSDMIDVQSILKDQEQLNHAIKSQMDQINRTLELKQQASIQPLQEQLQNLSMKSESQDKILKKLKSENENNVQSLKDSLKQGLQQINQKIEMNESNKSNFENILQRKISSVEDLFETQRKELYSSMSDLEKVIGKKTDNVVRAIKEITTELKISNPLLIY